MEKTRVAPLRACAGLTECSTLEVEARYSYPGMLLFFADKLDAQRLRRSLSQVLVDFPQYAGKLLASAVSLQIQHGEEPALFETVDSDSTLAALIAEVRAAGGCRRLEPSASILEIALTRMPSLLVRLTHLQDGCVLGIGWNHAVGDMHSTMLLMRAWCNAYIGRDYQKPILVTDRDAYLSEHLPNPPAARSTARRSGLLDAMGYRFGLLRPATRVSAEFSQAEIDALHRSLSAKGKVSRNDALCGHVYSVLRRLSPFAGQANMCLVVNFRKRLGLPDQVIGNMTSLLSQPVRKHQTSAKIAISLRRGLQTYSSKHVHYHPTARVFRACSRAAHRMRLISRQFRPGSADIFITNWDGFGASILQFGASKPVYFQPTVLGGTQLPQGFMIIYEQPSSKGKSLALGLSKAVAKRWTSPEGYALLHSMGEPEQAAEVRRSLSVAL